MVIQLLAHFVIGIVPGFLLNAPCFSVEYNRASVVRRQHMTIFQDYQMPEITVWLICQLDADTRQIAGD